jgi:hypothetical protein
MDHARAEVFITSSRSNAAAFPRPMTRSAKYSFDRRASACRHGGCRALPSGFGGLLQARCKVVAAQDIDIIVISAFCNTQQVQQAFSRVCACVGAGPGLPVHMIARACLVASVALLHNRDLIYISIGYRGVNLQRACNGCNRQGGDLPRLMPAFWAQVIEYGRIIGSGAGLAGFGQGGSGRNAGWAARAAGGWRAGQLAASAALGDGLARRPASPGRDGNSSMISMAGAADQRPDANAPDANPENVQQYQHVDEVAAIVLPTTAATICSPFGIPDTPPPLRGTPTPKPSPPAPLPACGPASFLTCAGKHPAKLRFRKNGSGRGWGRGLGAGRGSNHMPRQGRRVSGLAGCCR